MMSTPRSNRSGIAWAIAGGVVLIAGIVAIIVVALTSQNAPQGAATPSRSESSSTPGPAQTGTGEDSVVDPSVLTRGWVAEPIISDAQTYMAAALQAASTFDTMKSTRDAWLDYLDTWFTPDTRYAEADREDRMTAALLELRQAVVLPQERVCRESCVRGFGVIGAA